jgi:hypothetical protein
MKILFLSALLLAGCGEHREKHEWKCIGGITHERVNGAWVQIDGHPYMNFKDGPIKCSEEAGIPWIAK